MKSIVPPDKPKMGRADVLVMLAAVGVFDELAVLSKRGYYLNMGKPGVNDRGMYDDAVFIVAPDHFSTYNFNVDPSSYRKGKGTGSQKGMGRLKAGVYWYQPGPHPLKNGYPAFRQAGPVTLIRDGNPDYEDTGYFGVNIHRGSNTGTSSLACQTVPPPQWAAFQATLMDQLKRLGLKKFRYVLMD